MDAKEDITMAVKRKNLDRMWRLMIMKTMRKKKAGKKRKRERDDGDN